MKPLLSGALLLLLASPLAAQELEPYLPPGLSEGQLRRALESDLGSGISGAVPRAMLEAAVELEPERFGGSLSEAYARYGFQRLRGRELPVGIVEVRRLGLRAHQFNCLACHAGPGRSGTEQNQLILGATNHELDFAGWYEDVFGVLGRLAEREAEGLGSGPLLEGALTLRVAKRLVTAARDYRRREKRRLTPSEAITLGALARNAAKDFVRGQAVATGSGYGPGRTVVLQAYRSLRFDLTPGPYAPVKPPDLFGVSHRKTLLWTASEGYAGTRSWAPSKESQGDAHSAAERIARNGMLVPWIQLDPVRREPIPDSLTLLRFKRYLRMGETLALAAPPPVPVPTGREAEAFGRGRQVFRQTCLPCHGDYAFDPALSLPGGVEAMRARPVGYPERVLPLKVIGTDPAYLSASDDDFRRAFQRSLLGRVELFRPLEAKGYVARPLLGLRLRSPYLHNGSVPSLRWMLTPPAQRPKGFWVGRGVPYDSEAVGLRAPLAKPPPGATWRDTTRAGNRAQGHPFGTDLSEAKKRDLLAYLKRL